MTLRRPKVLLRFIVLVPFLLTVSSQSSCTSSFGTCPPVLNATSGPYDTQLYLSGSEEAFNLYGFHDTVNKQNIIYGANHIGQSNSALLLDGSSYARVQTCSDTPSFSLSSSSVVNPFSFSLSNYSTVLPTGSSSFTLSAFVRTTGPPLNIGTMPILSWGTTGITKEGKFKGFTFGVQKLRTANQAYTICGTGTNGFLNGPCSSAAFANPSANAFNIITGELFILDAGNGYIRKISPDGQVSNFAGNGTCCCDCGYPTIPCASFSSITVSYARNYSMSAADGGIEYRNVLYMAGCNAVFRVYENGPVEFIAGNITGGGTPTDGIGENAVFNNRPRGLTADLEGNLYVADWVSIRKIVIATRNVTTFAGSTTQTAPIYQDGFGTVTARFFNNLYITYDIKNNYLYVMDQNNYIRRIDIATTEVSTYAVGLGGGRGIAVDLDGNIYIADRDYNRIMKLVPTTKTTGVLSNIGGGITYSLPEGVAVDMYGTVIVMDTWNRVIRVITQSSTPSITDNRWHHLLVTYDGSTGTLKQYTDGALHSTTTIYLDIDDGYYSSVGIASQQTSCPVFCLGASGCDGNINITQAELLAPPTPASPYGGVMVNRLKFTGSLSDIRIYPRVLSSREIISLSQPPLTWIPNTATIPTSPTVGATGYWYECLPGFSGGSVQLTKATALDNAWSWVGGKPLRCIPCTQGSYAANSATVTCSMCSAGQYGLPVPTRNSTTGAVLFPGFTSAVDACRDCPAGFFSSTAGSTACSPCDIGSYNVAPRSSYCTSCSVGYYSTERGGNSSSVCRPCPRSTFGGGSSFASCISCPSGTASNIEAATTVNQCVPCLPGYYAPLGSSSCLRCKKGTFAINNGSSACEDCPVSTYGSQIGATSPDTCLPCPAGTGTIVTGASSIDQCIAKSFSCPSGTQPVSAAVNPASVKDCIPLSCRFPLMLEDNVRCVSCASGFYINVTRGSTGVSLLSSADCVPCNVSLGELCTGTSTAPLAVSTSVLVNQIMSSSMVSANDNTVPNGASGAWKCGTLWTTPSADSGPIPTDNNSEAAVIGAGVAIILTVLLSYIGTLIHASKKKNKAANLLSSSVDTKYNNGNKSIDKNGSGSSGVNSKKNNFGIRANMEWLLENIDAFHFAHILQVNEAVTKRPTALGGVFTIAANITLGILALILIIRRNEDNVLVQSSLNIMEASLLYRALSIPEAMVSNKGSALVSSFSSGVQVRLTTVGDNATVCKNLLGFLSTGLSKGNFVAGSSSSTTSGSTSSLTSSGIYCNTGTSLPSSLISSSVMTPLVTDTAVQHTWICKDCVFSTESKLEIVMDYSCQINLVEVAAVRADGTVSIVRASTADDASIFMESTTGMTISEAEAKLLVEKGPISTMDWEVATHFTTLDDTIQGISYKGYSVVNMSSRITRVPLSASPAGDPTLATLLPVSRAITLRIALPLQPFYSSVIWLEKTSTIQLVSSIIGLASIVSIFQMVFSHVEYRFFKGKDTIRGNNGKKNSNDGDSVSMTTNNQLKVKVKQSPGSLFASHNENQDTMSNEATAEKIYLPNTTYISVNHNANSTTGTITESFNRTSLSMNLPQQPQVQHHQRYTYPPEIMQSKHHGNPSLNDTSVSQYPELTVTRSVFPVSSDNLSSIVINPLAVGTIKISNGNTPIPASAVVHSSQSLNVPSDSVIGTLNSSNPNKSLPLSSIDMPLSHVSVKNDDVSGIPSAKKEVRPDAEHRSHLNQYLDPLQISPLLSSGHTNTGLGTGKGYIDDKDDKELNTESATTNNNKWVKHSDDEGDVWYVRADGTGESVWELPPGGVLI